MNATMKMMLLVVVTGVVASAAVLKGKMPNPAYLPLLTSFGPRPNG